MERGDRPVLQVLVGSTRPGRIGLPISHWVQSQAAAEGSFDVELVDLAEVGLPVFDEPQQPRLGQYQHEHTKAWSAIVQRADAFAFVVPEYNHGPNAAVKNAIDYLYAEWQRKPIGFVSYGGVAGGTRAVAMLKPIVSVLRMVPIPEGVVLPMAAKQVSDGVFSATESQDRSVASMVAELRRMVDVLRPLREG